jgi:alkaline phosphatase
MDDLDYAGLMRSSSIVPVTDSGAGATAIATGVRTKNNYAGAGPDGENLETLLDTASKLGKSTGLISDHDITNATMAAFGANVTNRDWKKRIAKQYAYKTQPDVMFGGGEKLWYTKNDKGKIPDIFDDDGNNASENLVQKLMDDGYQYAYDRKTFEELTGPQMLGIFQDDAYIIDNYIKGYDKNDDPHFVPEEDSVAKALEVLGQNPNGFFLAIEVDELDDAGHEHDGKTSIEMGQLVNRITEKVEAYREANPDVLFIVTADHETGGMTLEGKLAKSNPSGGDGPVPAFGTPENKPLGKGQTPIRWGPFEVKGAGDLFKVDWTTPGHSATPVPVTASGPGAERLTGIYNNTYIHEVAYDVLQEGMP